MKSKPHILITNDDGIYAPGIKHLWNAVKDMADVSIVAPLGEQSAVSLSITVRHPLRIETIEWPTARVLAVNGTPADCIKLALSVILPKPPDLILSGINVLYSGTVAGVIEGVLQGVPGIAFSLDDYHNPSFEKIEKYIPTLVEYALHHPLPKGSFLNVNFPKQAVQAIQGIRLTKQGKEYWKENPEQRSHPTEGDVYYWLGATLAKFEEEEEDSDIKWLQKGYITVVPIQVDDLTNHHHVQQQSQHFEAFMKGQFPA
jgi:5'-nucleotidase